MRASSRVAAMCLLLLCCAASLTAQVAQVAQRASDTARRGNRTISGTVLSATTGQRLPDCTVTLQDSNGGGPRLETTTDSEGNFSFTNLYDGKFAVQAAHRGYITAGLNQHEDFFTAIVTGEGAISTGLRFLIPPQAIVGGTITDEAGDAVNQAAVRLYREDGSGGREKTRVYRTTNADELGNYEFTEVAAGNYFLVAGGTPWYATRPQPALQGAPRPRSPLDVAFPTTYYPDVTDADAATPIPVREGDRIPINITLHAVPAVHISVRLPGAAPNQGQAMPMLREKIFGQAEQVQQTSYNMLPDAEGHPANTVEMSGAAPGNYELVVQNSNGQPKGVLALDATSDSVSVDSSQAQRLVDVEGTLTLETGAPLPEHTVIVMRNEDGPTLQGGLDAKGAFHFYGVSAGDYQLTAFSGNSLMVMKELTAAGATVEGSHLKVGEVPVALAAVMTEAKTSVRGFAKKDGAPAAGVMIVLIPADGNHEAFRRDQSDSDGSFNLKQVEPGRYSVVAIEDGWGMEWARPEVMERYLSRALKVTVPPHSRNLDLKVPLEVQVK